MLEPCPRRDNMVSIERRTERVIMIMMDAVIGLDMLEPASD